MTKNFITAAFCAFALVASATAQAEHNEHGNGYPYTGNATCQTFSNGRHFSETSVNVETARTRALHECRTAWGTNDSECRMNLSCFGQGGSPYPGYPNPSLHSCYTSVDGYNFSAQSSNPGVARNEVIQQCWNHPYVYNKGRCSTNVRCENYGSNPYPNPNPYPPYPNPNPYPPNPNPYPPNGGGQGYYCSGCQVGAKCSNGCPWGGKCNYVPSGNFWRVLRCN